MTNRYEAIVVGAGPNGLAAAITLARSGLSVLVLEANREVGGAARTGELTLPGYRHDLCSAVHPLAVASSFFRNLPLHKHGLDWIDPSVSAAHPLEGGDCALLHRDPATTAESLGADGARYLNLIGGLAARWEDLFPEVLAPPFHWPHHPFLFGRFGALGLFPAEDYARLFFRGRRARAMFAGIAAHANAPLTRAGTAGVGLMLNLAAHARGWPIPRGGAQEISNALAGILRAEGGEIRTESRIEKARELPPSRVVLWDLTPRQVITALGDALPLSGQRSLGRFRYGPGVFKMDWALAGPIPWRAPAAALSATVHLGGSLEEIAAAEAAPARGEHAERPYVLLSQPTLFDPSRAPPGRHVAWAYCHVPHGSTSDRTVQIESQIERFAPGFRDLILHRSGRNTTALEAGNANLVGGDINGGALTLRQLLFRPSLGTDPYRLPLPGHFLCSSSTPPGPGVHGMCGYYGARSALRWLAKSNR